MVHPHESVRPARPGDLGQLAELAGQAVAEKLGQKGGPLWDRADRRREPTEASFRDSLDDDDQRVVVGLIDDVIVGFGTLRVKKLDDGGLLGVVDDLYVEAGGRELGVGEQIMDALLDEARTAGCFGVDSLALPGDRSTKNFFESFGLVARAIVVHRPLSSSPHLGDELNP